MKTVCAWCFPGLLRIDGEIVSHGICSRHDSELCLRVFCAALQHQLEDEYSQLPTNPWGKHLTASQHYENKWRSANLRSPVKTGV